MILLRCSLVGSGILLGLGLDAAIWVHAADVLITLVEDVAPLVDEGLDVVDELLLIDVLLALLLRLGIFDVFGHLVEDWLDALERLVDLKAHALRKVFVLLLLGSLRVRLVLCFLLRGELFLGGSLWLFFGLDVLDQSDVSDALAFLVDNVFPACQLSVWIKICSVLASITINFSTSATIDVALGELCNGLAVRVDHLALRTVNQLSRSHMRSYALKR